MSRFDSDDLLLVKREAILKAFLAVFGCSFQFDRTKELYRFI